MGTLETYGQTVARLKPQEGGVVRIRSCAVWPADDLGNVLGTLEAGREVPVFGPVKHPLFSAGIGYVVPLIDPSGDQCRGYLSASVIEDTVSLAKPTGPPGIPLPDASASWDGPCLPFSE